MPEIWEDWEMSPEDIASIKQSIQDANDGFIYEMMPDKEGQHHMAKCGKCGRIGKLMEKPFPHKYGCPMVRK